MPTIEIENYINNVLNKIGLIKKNYGLIHIRTGDNYLKDGKNLQIQFAQKIKNILKNCHLYPNNKYLLISDNNQLKIYLNKQFQNLFIYILPITHLGESTNQNDSSLKNTMLDFFIMSYSTMIISLSPHFWGSGFSEWASVMYNIPYKKLII